MSNLDGGISRFNVLMRDRKTAQATYLENLVLPMPGHHNALNATAAIAVAYQLGLSPDQIRKALAGFGGVKRRFTRTGEWNGVQIFDDYGHHPVEIAAVLRAARASTKGKVIAVVQPHRFTRLQSLFDQFATCFNDADAVIVADVYAAGEQPIEGVDRDALVAAIKAHGHRRAVGLPAPDGAAGDDPRNRHARRLRRVSGRRQHHAMGLCASRATRVGRPWRVSFADISAKIPTSARGSLRANEPLAPYTWFRVGGPAQFLFMPADEDDLCYFLKNLPGEIPVTTIGLGSNLIVRDGGVKGVVIRLSAKGFGEIAIRDDHRLSVGAAVPDVKAARAAAEAGIDGLAFFRGIPGAIGGALRMNAGAHGGETRDALLEAHGVTRSGERRVFSNADMGFSYRHSLAPEDVIFTRAIFQGRPGDPAAILAEMERITAGARGLAADPREDRRFDLQEPAGPQSLAVDRRRRLSRAGQRRRAGERDALQLPDQSRRGHGRRHRGAGRGSARARARA